MHDDSNKIIDPEYAIPSEIYRKDKPNWTDTEELKKFISDKLKAAEMSARTYSKFKHDLESSPIGVGTAAFHPEYDLVLVTAIIPSTTAGGIRAKVVCIDRETKKQQTRMVLFKDLLPPTETTNLLYKK